MKNPGKHLLALVILTGALSAQAQVRTWAFSKDTVYEWAANSDSASLSNNGSDSLKFDSIALELVRPTATRFQVAFQTVQAQFLLHYYQGTVTGSDFSKLAVAAGQVKKLSVFQVEDLLVRTAKSSAAVQGDTLLVRMIFMASSGRGSDTLMLKGKQNLPAALRIPRNGTPSFSTDGVLFDLRGRRMERIPAGVKIPWSPTVSPRK